MGLLVILMSFLQLCFFLIEVFQEFKAGVRQLDYIQRHANTSLIPFQDEPLIISYRKVMAIGGRSRERGGQYKGSYCGHLVEPIGQPSVSPRLALRQSSVTCRRHVPVVYSSPRPLRPHLLKDSSLSNLSCSTIVPLQPPAYKVPHSYTAYLLRVVSRSIKTSNKIYRSLLQTT